MKTNVIPGKTLYGGTVLTVLVISSVLSVTAISYLLLIQYHHRLSARSQDWNLSVSVAEAGIEEGLQHLNQNYQALSRDGWSFDGVNYTRTRQLNSWNSYTVKIDPTSDPAHPKIEARGFVVLPAMAANPSSTPYFAAVGVNVQGETRPTINRAVRVVCQSSSLFLGSMVAREGIDLNGNGIVSDSFDSADPAKSTNGHYDPAKAGDKGDVASNQGIVGVVSVGNANIYGKVKTGPGGAASIGSQGMIGSHAWQATHSSGIEPGWATDDANYTFPDIRFPYSNAPEPLPGDIITVSGYSTNSSFVNGATSYPGTPPSGSMLSPVTTNTAYFTVSSYPGPRAGMTTNSAVVTVASYPGAVPGLITNSLSFTTTSNYPGAQYGLTTNSSTTTVASYPGNQPGLTTNITTAFTSSRTYPADGTYVGTVTTRVVNNGPPAGRGTWYDYYLITSRTYTYIVFSYSYPTAFSYSYLAPTYTYPDLTYSYVIYQTTPTYTTNHYDHVLINGDYLAPAITGSVYVQGKARLVLPNGLNMSGGQTFQLGPNGSIQIWAGGTSVTVSGNGVINPSGFSGNFILYCTDTVTSLALNGNGEFTGVLVAPNAHIDMNGGGNADEDFIGCLMVKSVKMNGHFKFHYDEALGRMPMQGRFLITSWDEIP
jgi:hypothetical protein